MPFAGEILYFFFAFSLSPSRLAENQSWGEVQQEQVSGTFILFIGDVE